MTNQRRETVWTWLQGLDARQISRAVDEVHKVVQGRVFEAMTTGEDVDDELLAGELLRAWLREQA